MSATSANRLSLLKPLIISQTKAKPTATVILLHGSCDSGKGLKYWIEDALGCKLNFPHIKLIYPTAPKRPYHLLQGDLNTVWFDRKAINPSSDECLESVDSSAELINELIRKETNNGILPNRIVLELLPDPQLVISGGFSMGGCLALQVGYRFQHNLAGVFALSSFLNEESAVYEALQKKPNSLPPLFTCHGEKDELVKYSWGLATFNSLEKFGVTGEFHSFPILKHDLEQREIVKLKKWIEQQLPDDDFASPINTQSSL